MAYVKLNTCMCERDKDYFVWCDWLLRTSMNLKYCNGQTGKLIMDDETGKMCLYCFFAEHISDFML